MDSIPLVGDEIDAGKKFLELLNDSRRVIAACWLRRSDDEERYLYVSLDGLTVENRRDTYGEVLRVASEIQEYVVDPFRVKLIVPEDPIAKAVADLYRQYPGRKAIPANNRSFAGRGIVEIYVYPQLPGKSQTVGV